MEFEITRVDCIFSFLHENICCWYSLEAHPRGASNEYPQHMFSWRNKKNNSPFGLTYLRLFYLFFFTFIDHKPRMTQLDSFEFHFLITFL